MTYPFIISKRKDSPFYSVRFKDDSTGSYLPAKSTRKKTKEEAIQEAFRMMSNQEHLKGIKKQKERALIKAAEFGDSELLYALEEMKKRGLIASVTITSEKNSQNFLEFLATFWDWEKSPYIKEKLRQGHSIHKTHVINMNKFVGKYWQEYFKDKTIGSITKDMVRGMFDEVNKYNISGHTKNSVIRSVTTPLKYAFTHDIITQDLTTGLVWYSEKYAERKILTPELAQAVFSIEWKDKRAKLANIIAMCTGMRIGEIRALRVCDLGENCIYVNHSWNPDEGLKTPKNGEKRIVQFPFPQITEELKLVAAESPFYRGISDFIFYSTKIGQPLDTDMFIEGLRNALVQIGLSEEEAKTYTFHAWRHFFATYLSEKLDTKLLQQQTGHKTRAMLEHYANHKSVNDALIVQNAQKEMFLEIIS